jgi:FkbM family methyltransferase
VLEITNIAKKYNLKVSGIAYIGANKGQELVDLLKNFPDVPIHLFEPQKDSYNALHKKYKNDPNLNFYNFGLGSSEKVIDMFTNTNNDSMNSSLLAPKDHLVYHPSILFEGREKIQIKKFGDLSIRNINLLKIDVQGYELEVLKGFKDFNDVTYILTEVNRKEMYKDCDLVKDLDKYLTNYGFIRVTTSWYKRVIPWGDAFYIKKRNISKLQIFFSKLKNSIEGIKEFFFLLGILKKLNVIR